MAGKMFASLANRSYRTWFIGALIANIGVWMQATAQNWIVLSELSDGNATAVGITMALQFGPQLLLVPITGVVADKFDRRIVQMVTRATSVVLALGLGTLLILDLAVLWHAYAFALALGVVNAFDTPARQAFVSDIVPKQLLPNAVALNSASFNSARLIGPAVAGVGIVVFGSGWIFIVNAICFLAVIISLLMVPSRAHDAATTNPRQSVNDDTKVTEAVSKPGFAAAFAYLRTRPDLIVIFVMVFIIGTFGMNFQIYASTMAVEFGHAAAEFGLLSSMMAIGSLAGALLSARRAQARMRMVIIAASGFGLVALVATFMPAYIFFALTMVGLGYFTSTMLTTANGFVQSTTHDRVRGRVLSLYFAILMGGTPIGAPLVGAAADAWGARWSVGIAAIAGVLAGLVGVMWLVIKRGLRIHVRRSGLSVTHVGRPRAGERPETQTQSLTAPVSVLRRDEVEGLGILEDEPVQDDPEPSPKKHWSEYRDDVPETVAEDPDQTKP